jgi:hypothetical protein
MSVYRRWSGQPFIKAFFDPFDTLTVDIGKTNQMRRDLPRRVVTTGAPGERTVRKDRFGRVIEDISSVDSRAAHNLTPNRSLRTVRSPGAPVSHLSKLFSTPSIP